jgi:phosphopantothenoylcysteine decarboxylase/phosphopantothenate--cysteine ligase
MPTPIRILITAGPTHEPIDAVRFIGNRSSGKMGLALAAESAKRGLETTLLLGPVQVGSLPQGVQIHRFVTCEDLRALLAAHAPATDILIMAAAVADYRPALRTVLPNAKFRRGDGPRSIELEPTPDLIAEVSGGRRPGQFLVAFALEPADEVVASAHAKLHRKGVDLVVGNPLQTMDSDRIEAVVVDPAGGETRTPGTMLKGDFAPWLMELILARRGT